MTLATSVAIYSIVALSLAPVLATREVRTLGRPDEWQPAEA